MKNDVQMSFLLPEELRRRFVAKARKNGTTGAALLRDFVRFYVETNPVTKESLVAAYVRAAEATSE